ncbi:MAG: hypothetical protein AB2814_10755 [Candidatus Sedimenticola endophacoides]
MMQTVDIHTHLLSPEVRFERLFDRVAMRLFGKGLGIDPARLARDPYGAYTSALIDSVRGSRQVRRVCLFGVDARVDGRGRELHRDPTVCAATDDVLALHRRHGDCIIPFLSVNPLRPDALDRLDEYIGSGWRCSTCPWPRASPAWPPTWGWAGWATGSTPGAISPATRAGSTATTTGCWSCWRATTISTRISRRSSRPCARALRHLSA